MKLIRNQDLRVIRVALGYMAEERLADLFHGLVGVAPDITTLTDCEKFRDACGELASRIGGEPG